MYYDSYSFEHRVVANPGAYGLTDVVDPCYSNGLVCGDPDQYWFWDGVHMTRHVHALFAREFFARVCRSSCFQGLTLVNPAP
jgi:phospholipase/lecithinase/hemolysin